MNGGGLPGGLRAREGASSQRARAAGDAAAATGAPNPPQGEGRPSVGDVLMRRRSCDDASDIKGTRRPVVTA